MADNKIELVSFSSEEKYGVDFISECDCEMSMPSISTMISVKITGQT